MSVSQLPSPEPSPSQYSLPNTITLVNSNAYGRDRISLTEWDTTTVPEVAQGGIFEAGGSAYQIDSDTSISVGSVSDGYVFIYFDVANISTAPFALTNTVPSWDSAKHGYYLGTGEKVLPFRMYKSGTSYTQKQLFNDTNQLQSTTGLMFEARFSSDKQYSRSGVGFVTIKNLDTVVYNYNNQYTNSTGVFTAQESGLYKFDLAPMNISSAAASGSILGFVLNNSEFIYSTERLTNKGITVDKFLNAGDTISVQAYLITSGTLYVQLEAVASVGGLTTYGYYKCYKIG